MPYSHRFPFRNGLPADTPLEYEEEVKQMRAWLATQPHLPELSDDISRLFLHVRDGDLERTKRTLDAFYTLMTNTPEAFTDRSLTPEWRTCYKIANFCKMPETTPDGYKVFVYRLLDNDPSKFYVWTAMKVFFAFHTMHVSEDGLCPGYIGVFDMRGLVMGHITRLNLTVIRKFFHCIQECSAMRLVAVHVVNTMPIIEKVIGLCKPFLKASFLNMLHFHGPVDSLGKYFPQSILPEEFGGEAGKMQDLHDNDQALMEKHYLQWFKQAEDMRVDESKRPDKRKQRANDAIFDGSFKRLTID